MKRFLLGALGVLIIAAGLGAGFDRLSRANLLMSPTTGGGGGACSQATAWLARNSLDGTHTTADTNMICGLVTDGTWAIGDFLYVYATQATTPALLNMISTSFSSTANGPPTFVADRGYTGADGSSTLYIDTGYNPATAGGHYTQNSMSIMVWSLTDLQASTGFYGYTVGSSDAPSNHISALELRTSADNFVVDTNVDAANPRPIVSPTTTALGSWIINRDGATTSEAYHNGVLITAGLNNFNASSVTINSSNFYTLALNIVGTGAFGGTANQIAAVWAGGSLDGTHALSLHSRVCTRLIAVGALGSC